MRENSLIKKPDPRPITIEATLLWAHPDRLVALDAKGYLYTWFIKNPKTLSFRVKEGDVVFVHADEVTREAYHMTPKNDQPPDVDASEEDQ